MAGACCGVSAAACGPQLGECKRAVSPVSSLAQPSHNAFYFVFTQQAREMVLEIIREKDQADLRAVRGDFSSRIGSSSIEVCLSYRLLSRPGSCVES